MKTEKPVIFFDGVCNLCNGAVQEIITRDKTGVFQFASLQSDLGQEFLKKHQMPTDYFQSFIVLYPNGEYYVKSNAFLEVLKKLGSPYSYLEKILRMIPNFFRDFIYSKVAQNRYRWFGKKESCMLPKPEWKERFIS